MERTNKLWWLPLDCDEWYKLRDTLTDRQRGWFVNLLVRCWLDKGILPTDLAQLAEIACPSRLKTFEKDSGPVLAHFPVDSSGQRRTHPKLKAEYEARLVILDRKKSITKKCVKPATTFQGVEMVPGFGKGRQ